MQPRRRLCYLLRAKLIIHSQKQALYWTFVLKIYITSQAEYVRTINVILLYGTYFCSPPLVYFI